MEVIICIIYGIYIVFLNLLFIKYSNRYYFKVRRSIFLCITSIFAMINNISNLLASKYKYLFLMRFIIFTLFGTSSFILIYYKSISYYIMYLNQKNKLYNVKIKYNIWFFWIILILIYLMLIVYIILICYNFHSIFFTTEEWQYFPLALLVIILNFGYIVILYFLKKVAGNKYEYYVIMMMSWLITLVSIIFRNNIFIQKYAIIIGESIIYTLIFVVYIIYDILNKKKYGENFNNFTFKDINIKYRDFITNYSKLMESVDNINVNYSYKKFYDLEIVRLENDSYLINEILEIKSKIEREEYTINMFDNLKNRIYEVNYLEIYDKIEK